MALGYDSVQRVTDGRRFRDREELLAAQAEEPSTLVLWHILDTENNPHHRDLLDISVLYPGGAIASDAMPWTLSDGSVYTGDAWPLPDDATSHPRSAGCFTRFIREWVRERQDVSLLEGVRKCALIPAEILRRSTPAMRAKGRLQPGADADIVVFDFETLTDRATFSAMNRPSEGVRHLVVSGHPLIIGRRAGCGGEARPAGAPARCRELMVPVPILLVTGFLGAGKTTVVNHLLAHAGGTADRRRGQRFRRDQYRCGADRGRQRRRGQPEQRLHLLLAGRRSAAHARHPAAARSAAGVHRDRNQRGRRSLRYRAQPDGSR